ncbi:hypothetical protein CEK26_010569 [Fusarium fujikuroi]|nr:hypothetical protein CEK27_010581 [Fusarium fujikuroi]QGI83849.1 hypothetical protein CEK25_010578 [Fusarium fujikuroi]QGI97500.1 hypothetical protein CEK26_010569 [Fusarium fujikuroi]
MNTLRQMLPQIWPQGYKRLDSSSSLEDVVTPEKSGSSLHLFVKRLLRLPLKTRAILIAALLIFPGLLALTSLKGRAFLAGEIATGQAYETYPQQDIAKLPSRDRRLSIVLPANNPDHDLCKVITSALALGYPAPVIVNWGKTYDKSKGWKGGSHLAKITGTLEYLDSVSNPDTPDENRLEENDIVVLTDSYDVWFQLPPEILLQRYHEANLLHCDQLPESPACKDLYGPNTHKDPEVFHDVRPKYLNSGSMIGPVGDMRKYFRRVHERMQRGLVNGKDLYSDQGIFGEIFAEQEIWRRWLRKNTVSRKDRSFEVMHSDFEYHVGLDYTQNLFIPTVFEEQDGEIIALSNETGIAEKSVSLGIEPRLDGVPDDIQSSTNPLNMHVLHDPADWGDMPVYADFYSTAIPVVVHHNAHKDGAKKRRYLWWDRIWFFPYLRQLIKAQLAIVEAEPLLDIAVNGERLVYWESRSNITQKKPKTFIVDSGKASIVEREFGHVCRAKTERAEAEKPWYDEVFRDGQGEL